MATTVASRVLKYLYPEDTEHQVRIPDRRVLEVPVSVDVGTPVVPQIQARPDLQFPCCSKSRIPWRNPGATNIFANVVVPPRRPTACASSSVSPRWPAASLKRWLCVSTKPGNNALPPRVNDLGLRAAQRQDLLSQDGKSLRLRHIQFHGHDLTIEEDYGRRKNRHRGWRCRGSRSSGRHRGGSRSTGRRRGGR